MELSSMNANKKIYEKPELELMLFETEEICAVSGEDFGMGGISID